MSLSPHVTVTVSRSAGVGALVWSQPGERDAASVLLSLSPVSCRLALSAPSPESDLDGH